MTLTQRHSAFWLVGLSVAGAMLFLALGNRNVHHFDEPVYLYAAAHYTPIELAAGIFEPGNIQGFFAAKLGHVVVLRALIAVFGQGLNAIHSIQIAYTALILMAALFLGQCCALLWGNRPRAVATALAALLSPLFVYLSPKLLSEVPAIFCAMASVLTAVLSVKTSGKKHLFWCLVSAATGVLGVLSRGTVLLLIGGAWNLVNLWCLAHLLSAWLGPQPSRRRVIRWLLLKVPLLSLVVLTLAHGSRPLLAGFGVGFSVVLALALGWCLRHARMSIHPTGSDGR